MTPPESITLPRSTAADADPFAGDDDLWAIEDSPPHWIDYLRTSHAEHAEFFRALFFAAAASGLLWAVAGAIALGIYLLASA